ncbi:hypothetical protein [Gordonia alkanivorans]|uniref:N-acetyltransferase domain-containing protein n=1 Tax=Gordonia alkanivorans NBRC 16433 TaxID=1027371 RepID=F9W0I7_9ACTN|nr:hypothetical protein [Gordonia alkanivorans]GAA14376.1 hypothetical protein GOALK_099_01160 [Gordonia alkanivorans NBRC 16433]
MTDEQYESIETVTLTGDDLDPVIELLADGLDEIPLYSWLLGEHMADRSLRKWLAEILVRPLLNAKCVVGARRGVRLVGLLVFQPHDADLAVDGKPPLTPADFAAVATVPGVRERIAELLTSSKLAPPADDAVNLRIGVVAQSERGGRATIGMMREIERFCTAASRPYYAWTGSETLRRYYTEVWGANEFAVEDWNGITMYGLVSDRPPRRRTESGPA